LEGIVMPAGFWLMSFSVFCSAFGPILVRESPLDAAPTAFWRLAFMILPTLLMARQTSPKADGRRRWLAPMPPGDIALGLLAGALYAVDLVLWNGAVLRTTVMEASVLVMLYPLLVALIGAWVLRQHAGWRLWLGCVICFGGIIVMSLHHALSSGPINPGSIGPGSTDHNDATGNLMAVSAAFFYAACFLITAHLSRRHPSLTVTFWQSLGAALGALPFSLAESRFLPVDLHGWLYMLGYSAITLTALLALVRSLKTLSAALAAILAYGLPLLASLFAAVLFRELPTTGSFIGGVVIILGLTLATRDKPRPAKPEIAGIAPRAAE
jgi:drug/metabolite transporter (DMT)-like permease